MKLYKLLILAPVIWSLSACSLKLPSSMMPSDPVQETEADKPSGGVDGGGGKGVVCRNETGLITSAESLDLFEGVAMYGLNITKSAEAMDVQILKALNVIPSSQRTLVEYYASLVKEKMRLLPKGTKLDPIDDSFEVVLPKNCQTEQLARFYSNDRILVDGEIWEKLGETDRAALILHEAVYAVNRNYGATDSLRSRHIVSHLFDPATQWTDPTKDVPSDALNCIAMKNGSLYFRAFQTSSNTWILKFVILGKGLVVSEKTAIIYTSATNDLNFNEAKDFSIVRGTDNIGNSIERPVELKSDFEGSDIVTIKRVWEAPKDINGRVVPGYQTLRYYLRWKSGSFPNQTQDRMMLNCSLKINR